MTVLNKFATEFTQIDVKKLDENFEYALNNTGPEGITFPDGTKQTSAAWDTFKFAQTFTASGTWTCPDNCFQVQLTMFGGGGNGGDGSTYNSGGTTFYSGGGGGGSSAVINNYRVDVVPGTVYTVTVGAATLPSSFGPLVTINPGVSGVDAAGSNTGNGGAGGAAFNVGTTYTSTDRTTTYPQSSAGNAGTTGTTSSNNNNQIGGDGGTLPIFNYAGGTTNGQSAAANTGAGGAGTNYTGTQGTGGSGLVIVQW